MAHEEQIVEQLSDQKGNKNEEHKNDWRWGSGTTDVVR
jgi:hypothetical protein